MKTIDATVTASDHTGATESLLVPYRSEKISPRHQERLAIVYVRQSSPHQVLQHHE